MITHQPRWSSKPLYWRADYETYLKIRALKRWYWMTVQHYANWRRWKRKTVYQHGTEPIFCTSFGHGKTIPMYGSCHTVHRDVTEQWRRLAQYPSAEPVEPLNKGTVEQINFMYDQVSAWFALYRQEPCPVMAWKARKAVREGNYQTTEQYLAELKTNTTTL